MSHVYIGISGVARAGKDTLADGLQKYIKNNYPDREVLRWALANKVKQELYDFVSNHYGVDIFNLIGEQKELIRPILVAHGCIQRNRSNGGYWVQELQKEINAIENSTEGPRKKYVHIISDIRFNNHGDDELAWIQDKNNGFVFHISRTKDGELIKPANEEEKINDPKVQAGAKLKLTWETSKDEIDLSKLVNSTCEQIFEQCPQLIAQLIK